MTLRLCNATRKLSMLLAVALFFSCVSSQANARETEQYSELKSKLAQKINIQIDNISDAPIEGLLTVYTARGIFYVTKDTNFVIQGGIFEFTPDGVVNWNEEALKSVRLDGLEKYSDSVIEFKAANEKYVVNVFTDATCGYCQKMHREINEYNDLGITVRYLAFPRAGVDSDVYANTVSIWCAADPQSAMTKAKLRQPIDPASCENKVAEQFEFGQKIGVSGTPSVILPDGSMQPGYLPAARLAQALNQSFGD